jgi:hypothetical protein
MSIISGFSEKVSVNPFLPISSHKNNSNHNLSPISKDQQKRILSAGTNKSAKTLKNR